MKCISICFSSAVPSRSISTTADDAPVQLARLPPVLAEVQYAMRLKGFMRPRKCVTPLDLVTSHLLTSGAAVKELQLATPHCTEFN